MTSPKRVKDNHSATSLAERTLTIGSAQLLGNPELRKRHCGGPGASARTCSVHNSGLAHSGLWFADIGYGVTGARTDTVSQPVAIPSGKTSATLSFYLDTRTTDEILPNDDVLKVEVLSTNGAPVLATPLATYDNLLGRRPLRPA